ncbi:hypothetical protein ABEB36_001087 [Hypothenemus hampei]|uniref:Uncharacterized protein n=1 Tax=Hypothenemus hampei TaxID=57062 RepID=A0ABD1FDE5_HYPHA
MEALEIRNVIEQNKNSTYSETNGDSKIETHNEEFMSNVEDEEVAIYFDTDLLLDHGIAQEDVKELKRAGLNTIKGILMCTKKKLVNLRGLNEEKVNKIRKISSKITMLNDTNCFMTALELSDQRKQVFTLTTGSDNLERRCRIHVNNGSIRGIPYWKNSIIAHLMCYCPNSWQRWI